MTQKKAKIEPVHIEEAEKLRRIFDDRPHPRLSQAKFGDQYEIGSQGVVWQYLNARIPLNVEQAVRFARGLNCSVADFSPRLAAELAELTDSRDADHGNDNLDRPLLPSSNSSRSPASLDSNPVRAARLAALRRMVEAADGPASFARQHPGVDPTYVSQLLNGHRAFGDRAARNMESRIGLPPGSLDSLTDPPEPSNVAPPPAALSVEALLDQLRERIATQPEAVRRAIGELVSQYVATPDEHSGRAVAEAIARLVGKPPEQR